MANYEYISIEAQLPESVLSVVDLEHDSSEYVLLITEQENEPIQCDFQHQSVNLGLHQPSDTMLTGKMNVDLFQAEEMEESYGATKTGALKAPVQIHNSHNLKVNNYKPSTIFKFNRSDQHPCVRRSQKNIRLNDPHSFCSPPAELSHDSSCGDSMGEPPIHSKQQHFIESAAMDETNLRCEQRNFKIPYGDQEVGGPPNESNILSAHNLTACKERSLAILQEDRTNSKEVGEKGHQKKGCFKKLLELCFITKNKLKTVKSSEAVNPILPSAAITNTQTEDKTSVSRNSEKNTQREEHHTFTGWLHSKQKADPTLFADGQLKFKKSNQENEKPNP